MCMWNFRAIFQLLFRLQVEKWNWQFSRFLVSRSSLNCHLTPKKGSQGHQFLFWVSPRLGGVGINLLWKCQLDISPVHAQPQNNLRTRRKSSWDFIIYSRANPTFPIVKYRSFLFLFLLPIHYNVNKGCGTTVNDMVLPLFPFTCVYILLLRTLCPYVRLAFQKFVVTDPPNTHTHTHRIW